LLFIRTIFDLLSRFDDKVGNSSVLFEQHEKTLVYPILRWNAAHFSTFATNNLINFRLTDNTSL